MNWLDRWVDARHRREMDRWERAHRWDALAIYNTEVSRGIVHTAEYDAAMAQEQAAFTAEMRAKYPPWSGLVYPSSDASG